MIITFWQALIISLLVFALGIFIGFLIDQIPRKRNNELLEKFSDYYSKDKKLTMRVFHREYEADAYAGISPSRIVDAGSLDYPGLLFILIDDI